ncbi:acyl-CoA dehydrogenase family protein [Euryarchaeota archaeon]|jgi:acyl-CoA dehydrogenase|nr:acyl-CoA dehydrogenase family protein [Euryarchaeota archaeon]
MDFAETDDQTMIRDMVRDFAETVAGPSCYKRDKEQIPPIDEFRQFAELGVAGMAIPEKYGGQKLDDISEAIVIEELSRVDPSLGVMVAVHVGLCSMTITLNGNEEQKEKYLPKLASGEYLGAYSLSEAGSGTDAAAMVARATEEDDCFLLNGEKMWVTNGTTADLFVLFAKVTTHSDYGVKKHGGVTCFIIEKDFEGFKIGKKEEKLGIRSSDTSTLILENCKVPKENVLGEVGKGFAIAMNALDNSRIGIAAQGLGIAQGAYEAALKYSKERETFGKPIAAHQSISNYLADMALRIDAARLQVYKAAWAKQQHYENGATRHTLEASFAKLNAGDTAMWVSEKAVQVLGGYGYTTEFPVERFFRDAKITQIYEGTQEVQRLVIAREIGK